MSTLVAEDKEERGDRGDSRGRVFVVGIGPGDPGHLTAVAREAIERSTVVVGYRRYVDLIGELAAGRQLFVSGMTEEVDRCRKALELAMDGEVVSLVSGGDPGVYGMAGLVLELNRVRGVEVEVIPGVSAVNAAASRVGAPLMHDFAVLSLSDLLTPWELIERRIRCAAEGDFVIALYNPRSRRRVEQIVRAKEIIRGYRPGTTPVAVVTNACRKDESIVITDLDSFTDEEIGMLSIVIIGNSQTERHGNRLVTPRGYRRKYADSFQG